MKASLRYFLPLAFLVCFAKQPLHAQIGIGTNTPDANAVLELESTDKGLLPPRLTTTARNNLSIGTGQAGMTVFDSNLNRYFVWDGGAWLQLRTGAALWTRSGTDLSLVNSGDNVGIGTATPAAKLNVAGDFRLENGTSVDTIATSMPTIPHNNALLTSAAIDAAIGASPGNTLDAAYDQGGGGSGRTITADNGAVEINGVDGLVSTGTFGNGSIPASGNGIRLMWYPSKAAFRVGEINDLFTGGTGTEWDDGNIGFDSFAAGINTTASGSESTAMGKSTTASGGISTAMGGFTIASANFSTAMGRSTTASGGISTAMGDRTNATDNASTAMGEQTNATANASTAMGFQTTASGDRSTAMGSRTTASGDFSTAMGNQTAALSFAEVALGTFNDTTGYTPNSTTSIDPFAPNDRLLVVGNGQFGARSNALVILKNGNTGIGVNNPAALLDVKGDFHLRNGATVGRIATGMPTAPTDTTLLTAAAIDAAISDSIATVGGSPWNTNGLGIDYAAGNVGINTTTPNSALNVNGDISLQSTGTSQPTRIIGYPTAGTGNHDDLRIQAKSNPSSGTLFDGGNLQLIAGDYNSASAQTGGRGGNVLIKAGQNAFGTFTNDGSDIRFYAGGYSVSGDIERMRIEGSSGNVGIGVNNPAALLNVAGDFQLQTGTNVNEIATVMPGTPNDNSLLTSSAIDAAIASGGGGNTLDAAYDEGGAGAGRTITADNGAVQIDGGDGLVSTGTLGSGALAPTGAGVKMYWNPNKAAFRAGEVAGTQWDDVNVGERSFAVGRNSTASGNNSTAMGNGTDASGLNSTAMGSNTTASGLNSTAMGQNTSASNSSSTAMGLSTTASGDQSTAMGLITTASGDQSTAMGNQTTAPSFAEVAVGTFNTSYSPNSTTGFNAADRLFVVGNGSGAGSESNALVILKNGNTGIGTSAPDATLDLVGGFQYTDGNQAAGRVLTSDANGNATWQAPGGGGNTLDAAYDQGGAGLGRTITANSGAVTINGEDGLVSTGTLGAGTTAPSGAGVRMVWNPNKAAFRAGEVTGAQWDDANVGDHSFAVGEDTEASGDESTAMGNNSTASGLNSTAMGSNTTASGLSSTAMGSETDAIGNRSTAMGRLTTASGIRSTAMGNGSIASGRTSTAMGVSTTAPSFGEVVVGTFNTSYTPKSTNSFDAADRLFVVGNGQLGARSNAMVILKNGRVGIGTNLPGSPLEVRRTDGKNAYAATVEATSNSYGLRVDVQSGAFPLLVSRNNSSGFPMVSVRDNGASSGDLLSLEKGGSVISVFDNNGDLGLGTDDPNATLHVEGSVIKKINTVNSNYTVAADDYTVVQTAGGANVLLPQANGTSNGRIIRVKAINISSAVSVFVSSGGTIDGSNSVSLNPGAVGVPDGMITVQSDGSQWLIIDTAGNITI